MCAAATVPNSPLTILKEFVDPTPTKFTFIISSSILSKDLPAISEASFKNILSVDMPTSVDSPTETTVDTPIGLWIILSMLINARIVASSDGTDKVWFVPMPVIFVNETAIPALAKLAAIETCIISESILIAKISDGNNVVAATPVFTSDVSAIPIGDWPDCGLYINFSPVLKLCLGIVYWCVSVDIPEDGLNPLWNNESPSVNRLKLVVPITPPPVEVTIPVNWDLKSSIKRTLFVLDSL